MRITVEAWDPEYGSPLPSALEPSAVTIDPRVELAPAAWRPLSPATHVAPASEVLFVDGVRRIEALVWLTMDDGRTERGLCASYAAGAVRCSADRARVEVVETRRGLLSARGAAGLDTRAGAFDALATANGEMDRLSLALQQRLGELEVELGSSLGARAPLVVVDGPLSGRQDVPGAVGYVKTHRVSYLPDELERIVARLGAGERTPVFATATGWTRFSWYMRLPGPLAHAWSGVVRLEASADQPAEDAVRLADLAAATLPAYASEAHKEPRAPQNLYPIAGLERELQRRLGDAGFVRRALRSAAARESISPPPS